MPSLQPGPRVAMKEEVRRLLARRYTQAQIAKQLGISQPAVSKWKAKIEADAQAAAADRAAEIRAALDSLAEVEREAWGGWGRSQQDEETTLAEDGATAQGSYEKRRTVRRGQAGDPAFLTIILACQQQRRQLLGLDAPTKAQEFIMQELSAGLERLRHNLEPGLFDRVARLLAGEPGGVVSAP